MTYTIKDTASPNVRLICEGQTVIATVAGSRSLCATMAAGPDLLAALFQYRNDLRHPPQQDSIERRLEMIDRLIAKAEAA